MLRPLKKLETAWNSRTPEYLHNGTKANLIWQIKMGLIFITAMWTYDELQEYLARRNRPTYTEDHYPVTD